MITHLNIAKEAEERKEEIEQLRNIPEDLIAKVKDGGLVKSWATKSVGGRELSVSEVSQTIAEIAYHNGSMAWVVGVTGCSALFSGFVDADLASLLFHQSHAMVGGFAGPAGMALKTEGGLKVTGRWSWGSGITHCTHIVGGVMLIQDGQPKGSAVVFFEPQEIEEIDNWHVSGLKGTHSIDYKADEVFIPDGRWSMFPVKEPLVEAPIYNFSFLGALSVSVCSVALGLARRAVQEIKDLAQKKSPFGMGRPLSQRSEAQQEIGMIEGKYLAAESFLYRAISDAEEEAERGLCSKEMKARVRLATAQSTALCDACVWQAHRLAGGSAVWDNNKLSELLRDIQVVTQHGMVSMGNFKTVGKALLGGDVHEMML